MNVRLYTTLGCHLCEQAMALLQQTHAAGRSLEITEVEIADSDELIERYGIRVPVIATDNDVELGWPFSYDELQMYLNENG